jgi:hypothetical protein
MPATLITPQQMLGPFESSIPVGALNVVMQSSDRTNGNSFKCTGREIVIISNSSGGPATVTFTSTADGYGRTKDITDYTVLDGAVSYFTGGLTNAAGWKNSSGLVTFKITAATNVNVAILRLP